MLHALIFCSLRKRTENGSLFVLAAVICESNSVGRVPRCQCGCRGFESRLSLTRLAGASAQADVSFWRRSQVVRQRSAKSPSPVRLRSPPSKAHAFSLAWAFLLESTSPLAQHPAVDHNARTPWVSELFRTGWITCVIVDTISLGLAPVKAESVHFPAVSPEDGLPEC